MPHRKAEKIVFEITRHLNDKRVDAALFSLLQEKYPEEKALSRGFVSESIRLGKVTRDGVVLKPSALVSLHDVIEVEGNIFFVEKRKAQFDGNMVIKKIYEDENILVINKPENLKIHASGTRKESTLTDWILLQYPKLKTVGGDPLRPGIVHRLDRETSGVLVIAKNEKSFQALKKKFLERKMEKTYLALVYGNMKNVEGKIDTSLMRLSGELKRKAIDATKVSAELSGNIRTALTYYKVIARYKDFDLLSVAPKTGRTHQIRVHLSSLGHPVVGDKLYAFKPARRGDIFFPERHLLHATTLTFSLFGKKYTLRAPLPADFRQTLQDIDPAPFLYHNSLDKL